MRGGIPLRLDALALFIQVLQQLVIRLVEDCPGDLFQSGEDVSRTGSIFAALKSSPKLTYKQSQPSLTHLKFFSPLIGRVWPLDLSEYLNMMQFYWTQEVLTYISFVLLIPSAFQTLALVFHSSERSLTADVLPFICFHSCTKKAVLIRNVFV